MCRRYDGSWLGQTNNVVRPQSLLRDFADARTQGHETALACFVAVTPLDRGQHGCTDENQSHRTGGFEPFSDLFEESTEGCRGRKIFSLSVSLVIVVHLHRH